MRSGWSPAAASVARPRSTRRSRCARTRRTWRSGDEASGLVVDLDPHYDRVEERLGVRERTDWPKSVRTVEPGFRALGSELEPVRSYTDANCMRCGSCLQGCPTNAGKSTLNTYIHDAWAAGRLELRADARVERVRDRGRRGGRVSSTSTATETVKRVDAGAVVVAAGTLNTPQLLLRSGLPDSPSSRLIGRNLGFHPARLVYGLFDEPQDAHMVYPITAHAMGAPARRGRRLRDRGDDDPGSDRLRDDARGRERPALGNGRSSRR